jgi:CDGSH-type Zn-finger protein/uncharacterized Fe-S cluster protein YjdI
MNVEAPSVTREQLLHALYEAAELEHDLMCTYLYSAFSLRDGETDGLSPAEADAVIRWRRVILQVAVEEMGHLTAIWNITSALGGSPHFGRENFPLEPGYLPAGVTVKLAPFNEASLQHFIHLERPAGSAEPEGPGFTPDLTYHRGSQIHRLTPMGLDYDTVGTFYATLEENISAFVARVGEKQAFCGDPALQLSAAEVPMISCKAVICLKTALAAFKSIIEQGEGAPEHMEGSHFQKFCEIRAELAALKKANPDFHPAHPAATNPVLRPPPRPEGRVWIDDEEAAETVDLANTGYALMLRLIGYSYAVPRPDPEKALAVNLALGLMRAMTKLAERAARLPSGRVHACNAGMSFAALRDAASLPRGPAARLFFTERLGEMASACGMLAQSGDARVAAAAKMLGDLSRHAARGFVEADAATAIAPAAQPPAPPPPQPAPKRKIEHGVETVQGEKLNIVYEGRKCIHSRFCVTGAPKVFLANVQGAWIYPDAMDAERLVDIAHACPSGAIRYARHDGRPDEAPPPVNLVAVREAGPYAVRGDIRLDGEGGRYRMTLCRCGASKNKPFCDGSHHDVHFAASGEPPTGQPTGMLSVRDGPLAIDPETDGPLQLRGNIEIISGTGRVVARLATARLCRCGGSSTKPFCDGTHAKIGFKSS